MIILRKLSVGKKNNGSVHLYGFDDFNITGNTFTLIDNKNGIICVVQSKQLLDFYNKVGSDTYFSVFHVKCFQVFGKYQIYRRANMENKRWIIEGSPSNQSTSIIL